ncbi:MAG: hypothetical protein WEB33_08630 [Bacteroidota bacterium]
MFLRKPKYHRFEYLPRFYNPEKDSTDQFRRKLRRERGTHRRKSRPILWWFVVAALAVYAYVYLAGVIR